MSQLEQPSRSSPDAPRTTRHSAWGCAALVALGACFITHATAADASSPTTTQPAPIDLHNTKCPVSGDDVADSKLSAVYDGKIYHFCCDSCPADFKKDPQEYAKLVAADPAKYGVKNAADAQLK